MSLLDRILHIDSAENHTDPLNSEVAGQPQQPARHGKSDTSSRLSVNFFRAVSLTTKGKRLGELLYHGGLITAEELYNALQKQKETREPIGKVLVRMGVVSAAHVYRKLAEQWCIRASTAGIALMVNTATPTVVEAASETAGTGLAMQFRLASAMAPASIRPMPSAEPNYPHLFGTYEIRSSDISAFKKWTSVIGRFEEQMRSQSTAPRIQMWKTEIQKLKNNSAREQLEAVNTYINQVRYIEDIKNYGKSDYWATPVEFFSKGGDCEDFAIAKYASLRALGYSSDQMRITIVQDKLRNLAHAILIVYVDGKAYVLDNQNKNVERASNVARYQPVFSINSDSWWLHKKTMA